MTTEFKRLLNAFEAAAQADKPAAHRYGEHRQALVAYVRGLESQAAELAAVKRDAARWQFVIDQAARIMHGEGVNDQGEAYDQALRLLDAARTPKP